MKNSLIVIGLIILAMLLGFWLGQPDAGIEQQLRQEVSRLKQNGEKLATRNQELEKTLDLVRLQIQTDRIAYDALQQTVEKAEAERLGMQQKLQSQRELLEKLKQKLEDL